MPTHHAPEHVPRSWRSCNRCSLVCILNPDSKVERQNLRYLSLTSRHLGFSYHRYKHITNLSSKKKKKKIHFTLWMHSFLVVPVVPFKQNWRESFSSLLSLARVAIPGPGSLFWLQFLLPACWRDLLIKYFLPKEPSWGVPLWHSRLSSSLGCCCGSSLVPCLVSFPWLQDYFCALSSDGNGPKIFVSRINCVPL